jgi:hypothetical protein
MSNIFLLESKSIGPLLRERCMAKVKTPPKCPPGQERVKEGRWAFELKVDCTEKGSNRIKGFGSQGRQGVQKRVRYMTGDMKAFDVDINPIHGEIRQINSPGL